MKKMKAKLMASVAMLLVATIMVTSTSYAWYTINTYAKVSEMNITLAKTENVEIAKAYLSTETVLTEIKDVFTMVSEVTSDDASEEQETFGGTIDFPATGATKLQLPAEKLSASKDNVGTSAVETTVYRYNTPNPAYNSSKEENATTNPKTLNLLASVWNETYPLAPGMAGVVYNDEGRTDGFRMATAVTDPKTGLTTYEYSYDATDATKKATIALSYNMFIRTNVSGKVVMTYDKATGANSAAQVSITYADLGVIAGEGTAEEKAATSAATFTAGSCKGGVKYFVPSMVAPSVITADMSAAYVGKDYIQATADHVYLVQVFAYVDGEQVKAADVDAELNASLTNIKFVNLAIDKTTQDWEGESLLKNVKWEDGKLTGLQEGYVYQVDTAAAVTVATGVTEASIAATSTAQTVVIKYTKNIGTTEKPENKVYTKTITIPATTE